MRRRDARERGVAAIRSRAAGSDARHRRRRARRRRSRRRGGRPHRHGRGHEDGARRASLRTTASARLDVAVGDQVRRDQTVARIDARADDDVPTRGRTDRRTQMHVRADRGRARARRDGARVRRRGRRAAVVRGRPHAHAAAGRRRPDGRAWGCSACRSPRSTAARAATTSRCASRSRRSAASTSRIAITLEAGVSLGAMPVFRFGTEEQKQELLPDLLAGRALAGFGLTEPEAGSRRRRHPHHRAARRRRVGHQRLQAVHHQLRHRRSPASSRSPRSPASATAARRSRRSSCPAARPASPSSPRTTRSAGTPPTRIR